MRSDHPEQWEFSSGPGMEVSRVWRRSLVQGVVDYCLRPGRPCKIRVGRCRPAGQLEREAAVPATAVPGATPEVGIILNVIIIILIINVQYKCSRCKIKPMQQTLYIIISSRRSSVLN